MAHLIQKNDIEKHTKSISDTKKNQVSNLQNHIQDILSGTHHTFLQGSYRNITAISDINDVDIVAIKLNTYSGVHSPSVLQNPIAYPVVLWDSIFNEITTKLRNQKIYSWTITPKEKCIAIETQNFKADIVPAVQVLNDITVDPIAIRKYTGDHLSYPRIHFKNGSSKQLDTNNNYKPMVRMFKNWVKNYLPEGIISSHKIESLIHNVPNEKFTNDYFESFIIISDYIVKLLDQRDTIPINILSVCEKEDICSNWSINNRQFFKEELRTALDYAILAYRATSVESAKDYWNKAFNL